MMKKMIAAVAALTLAVGACGAMAEPYTNDWSVMPEVDETAEQNATMDYTAMVEQFADALADKAEGLEADRENTPESVLMGLDAAGVGYVLKDLNGDGHAELMVVASDPDNPFMDKMVLLLATTDGTEGKVVFESGERSRYYYAGENRFAYEGSNGADDSTMTTYALEGQELVDLHTETDQAAFVAPEMEMLNAAE